MHSVMCYRNTEFYIPGAKKHEFLNPYSVKNLRRIWQCIIYCMVAPSVVKQHMSLSCDVLLSSLQAKAAAAEVMLVASYAWHWRNVTLQRRQQAQARQYAAPAYGTYDFCHNGVVSQMLHREPQVFTFAVCHMFLGYHTPLMRRLGVLTPGKMLASTDLVYT